MLRVFVHIGDTRPVFLPGHFSSILDAPLRYQVSHIRNTGRASDGPDDYHTGSFHLSPSRKMASPPHGFVGVRQVGHYLATTDHIENIGRAPPPVCVL